MPPVVAMGRGPRRARAVAALAVVAFAGGLAAVGTGPALGHAGGYGPVESVHAFDATKNEAPEDLAFDKQGNLYVSLLFTGEIRRFGADGTQSTLVRLPVGRDGLLGGLALDHTGNIYAAVSTRDPLSTSTEANRSAIWLVRPDGTATVYGELASDALPNGVALDRFGNIFVADSHLGVIWRVPAEGGTGAVWSDDPAIRQRGVGLPVPGPNGIKFFKNELYVTVSEKLTIYRIPVLDDGQAGPASVYAEGIGGDNVAFDQKGNLYVTTDPFNTVVVVRADGTQTIIASAEDGLDGPSAVAFGTRLGEEDVLYITNLAIFSAIKRPSLMRMHIGVPGKPLP